MNNRFELNGAIQEKPKDFKLDGPPFTISFWIKLKNCYPYPFAEPFMENN